MAKKPKSEVKPLCPVTYSLVPDTIYQTETIEAFRLQVNRNSGGAIGSIAVSVRCVCGPDATAEEFEYTKTIANVVRRAMVSIAEHNAKVTKRKG